MNALVDIAIKLALKLLTESVVARIAILAAWEGAKRTATVFDDDVVKTAAAAWGVQLPPK